MTDDLIDRLVSDLAPVSRTAVAFRLAVGIVPGMAISAMLMALWLGLRPDLGPALATGAFWLKFAYTALLSAAGLRIVERWSRPGVSGSRAVLAGLAVLAAVAAVAIAQWLTAPADLRPKLVFGASSLVCPWYIVALSMPIFAGAFWALRSLAPTHLLLSGAGAGLMAGALGAWIYSFHCDETGLPFLAIWYTLGITSVGLLGAVLGRRLLRW